jgi:hypothetical protein
VLAAFVIEFERRKKITGRVGNKGELERQREEEGDGRIFLAFLSIVGDSS